MKASKLKAIIQLLRLHQWVKNLFIFLPVFFGMKITNAAVLINAVYLFFGFSLIASAVYVFNDYFDLSADRLHPKKKFRPLASGTVGLGEAKILIFILLAIGASIIVFKIGNIYVYFFVAVYVLQNVLYTIKLKQIPIVDIAILSLGFVIRIIIGSLVTNIILSHWIVLMTFILAMFLALAKRSDDVRIMNSTSIKVREGIDGYNLEFLNLAMTIMSVITIVTYIMYTTSPEVMLRLGPNTYMTTFFVILGIIRYLQISIVKHDSGNPTRVLLKDLFLQIIIIGWLISFILLIYV